MTLILVSITDFTTVEVALSERERMKMNVSFVKKISVTKTVYEGLSYNNGIWVKSVKPIATQKKIKVFKINYSEAFCSL